MKAMTRATQAATALERWLYQYPLERYPEGRSGIKPVVRMLRALGTSPSPEQVAEIAGKSWVAIKCDECGDENPAAVVQLGEEPDYESNTATICNVCLRKALTEAEQLIEREVS